VKPAPFRYAAPDTLDEAIALSDRFGDSARMLAGGQSLLAMMNLRIVRPEVVIDLNRVPGLAAWRQLDGSLRIGAMLRQQVLETPDGPTGALPLLGAAIRHVGHRATRSRGTVGGSLAHADPAAELPACMLALDAEIVAQSSAGERTIPAAAFFRDTFTTALSETEILCEIRVPVPSADRYGCSFIEIARRHGDFAVAAIACVVEGRADGRIGVAKLAMAGVGPVPLRLAEAELVLAGADPTGEAFAEAGRAAMRAIDPPSDLHATAEYRRAVAPVLVERALAEACRAASLEGAGDA